MSENCCFSDFLHDEAIRSRPGTSGSSIARRSREGEGEDGGYLTLKVVRPSQEEGEGIEIHFRVKQTTQVKKAYFV